MQLEPLLKFEPLMQFESLPQLEPGGQEVLSQAAHFLVVDKECRRPAVCCKANTEYRQDLHQSTILTWGRDEGRETRLAHLRKRRSKKVAERLHLRFHTEPGDVGEETT